MIGLTRIDFACTRSPLREDDGWLWKKNLLASLNLLENSNASDFDSEVMRGRYRLF
jgi:hypothetical protein